MAFLTPEKIIKQLPLEEGLFVADFGAGVGTFAVPIAKQVGKTGRVYAIDINQDILSTVSKTAREEGLENVEIIWGDIESEIGTKLKDGLVGLVLLVNTLFQAENKEAVLAEIKRILKRNGSVLVVDWKASFGGLGPKDKDVLPRETAEKLFLNSGFVLYNEIDADEYHYGLLFRKL
ncbi:MAG: class I SAM-dependent methyltransferase [Patescibacteria group bacterium]